MRIYELAKKFGLNSKDLIEIIEKELNINVGSHMSSISDEETKRIENLFRSSSSSSKYNNENKGNEKKQQPEKADKSKEIGNTDKDKAPVNSDNAKREEKKTIEKPENKQVSKAETKVEKPEEKTEKPAKDNVNSKSDRPEKTDRGDKPFSKGDKADRPERTDRGDKPFNKGEKRSDRPDRGDRPYNKGERPDRPDRGDKPFNKGDKRPDRPDRGDRPFNKGERSDRPDRGDRPFNKGERSDRPDRGDRPFNKGERSDRPDRGDRPFNKGERSDRPDRGDRPFNKGDKRPDNRGDRPFNKGDKRPDNRGDRQFKGDKGFSSDVDLGLEVLDKSEARGSRTFNKDKDIKKDNKKNNDSPQKKQNKIKNINNIDDDEYGFKGQKSKNQKGNKQNKKDSKQEQPKGKQQPKIKNIEIEDTIVVRDLADKMGVNASQVIAKLMMLGLMVNMNQEIDFDTASLIAEEFNAKITKKVVVDELKEIEEKLDQEEEDSQETLVERPPIVTVMGHVDHGKTSLLDAIRNTIETAKEAGGITQHIGASIAEVNGKKITFLDTPGHEAFTSMRARGASITDIAILVVAADDGVKPQTIEAINHAKAANVPLIVAVNKMDKNTANIDKVKQELSEQGVLSEEWGGDTIFVPVSAKKQDGIQDLLEMILLVAEMQELKANPNRKARGTIIEAKLDKGRGPVATVLVQKGTLNKGDYVLVGSAQGRVRAMFNSLGKKINQAGPSIPVEIVGLSETPLAGDVLIVMDSEKDIREIAEMRKERQRSENMTSTYKVSLDDLYDRIQMGDVKDLNIILKADVRGSIEAIKQSFEKLSNKEVKVNIIHNGVGGINENDINLASASNALVIGFNVRPSIQASELARSENVDIRTYNIIYNAIEDLKQAINGMLAPEFKEVVQGRAEVRAVYKIPNIGNIAGVYVLNGKITRKSKIRLLREDIVIHEGEVMSLKRFKDDASELNTGFEGGVGIEKFTDIKEGDIIEAYILEEIKR